ncbi:MAG: hypothetical protein WC780_04620 [Lentimicrobiaceae bacterium]|jgi:hypothetical protein
MINEEIDFTDPQMLRHKAEEQLKKQQKKTPQSLLDADAKKILHELQVHQIELEMQNEELHHAYETTEATLKKYTMLYDFAPIGYFILDYDGSISDLNFTGAEMLGDRRIGLLNSNFKLYIADESKLVFDDFFRKVFANILKETCEIMLGYDGCPLGTVYLEGISTGDDNKCFLSVVDVSLFKKTK